MTTVAAPVRRPPAVAPARGRAAPVRGRTAPAAGRTEPAARRAAPRRDTSRAVAAPASGSRARIGVAVVIAIVFVLLSAVLFHVLLAQGQLQLDQLDSRIATERLEYEQRRLEVSTLASPQRIIEQAQQLGLVIPDTPRIYLEVPGAKVPAGRSVNPATTLSGWEDVKPNLGDPQP